MIKLSCFIVLLLPVIIAGCSPETDEGHIIIDITRER